MALLVADRVQETTTTTGTGNIALDGAVTGYQTFASALANGDTTYYTIADQTGSNWEVGLGTFTSPSTLARTTILSSSNSGSAVSFTAGTKNVFITYPAGRSVLSNSSGVVPVAAGGTSLSTLTANNVLLGNGTSAVQFVAPGTSGNALISNGTTWSSSSVPGGWVYLSTVTASGSATADIETTFDSTYDNYAIVANSVYPSTTGQVIWIRFKISGVYATSLYNYATMYNTGATVTGNQGVSQAQIILTNLSASNSTSITSNFTCNVYAPSSTSVYKTLTVNGISNNVGTLANFITSSWYAGTTALTGVRFLAASGNINGTFRLYGIKKS